MPQTNKKITALYCRLSREDLRLGESESIQNQKQILERFAKENHLPNIRFFIDDGVTGVDFDCRDGLQEMLDEVEAGNVATVVTKDLSRLGRNYLETGKLIEVTFPQNGVRYIAISDCVDTAREDNEFTPLRNWVNEFYARDTSKKIRAVKLEKARRGERANGEYPYGYLRDPNDRNHLIPDPETAPNVKKIFEMYIGGARYSEICDWLHDNRIITPSERRYRLENTAPYPRPHPDCIYNWNIRAIAAIIRRREYTGTTVTNKGNAISYKIKRRKNNDDSERFFFPNSHEPLVDEETFELAQKRYAERTRPRKRNMQVDVLSGVLFCADCGNKMHALHPCEDGSRNAYNCGSYRIQKRIGQLVVCTTHYVRENILIELVLKDVKRVLRLVTENERAFISAVERSGKKQEKSRLASEKRELKTAEARLAELNTLFRKSYEDNALGKISDEQFSFLTCGFDNEKNTLEARITELNNNIGRSASHVSDARKFVAIAKKYADLSELTFENVNALIDKVLIHELDRDRRIREIEIFYSGVGKIPNDGAPSEVTYNASRCGGIVSTIVV